MNPPSRPRLLQIFNRTLGGGGEDLAVQSIAALLTPECEFRECLFASADWTGPPAPPKWKQAAWMMNNPEAIRRILAAHRAVRAEAWILHNFVPVISAAVYRAAAAEGVPVIQFAHNFRPFSVNSYLWAGRNLPPADWRRNFLREIAAGSWQQSRLKTAWLACVLARLHWRKDFRAVKAWVAVSEFVRDKFIEAGVPARDVFALRHSWSPQATVPAAPDSGGYLFLGRLIEEKGVNVLLDTWEILARDAGPAAPKLIIGGDGPLAGRVAEAARRNPRIEYCGVLAGEKKQAALAGCRAVLVPSIWWEPLGLVVYEACDFARPVCAAASGGLAELVQHGHTGLLHPPGAAAELARQILTLERDPVRRREMGDHGRAWLLAGTRADDWKRRFFQIVDYACGRTPAANLTAA